MNNETYGIKLEAFIKPFVDKIRQATQVSKQASDIIKKDLNIQMNFDIDNAKKRLKEIENLIKEEQDFIKEFKNAPVYMKQESEPYKRSIANVKALESEYNDLTNQIEKYNAQQQKSENSNKMLSNIFDKIKKSAKENASQIKRMTMSLIGVRSVYLMISRASSTYLSQDEETNQKMQASWAALGSVLAPLLEYMSNLMLTFAKAVNYVILQLTGVDYVARALNKTLSTTKKQLTSIDEITNLGENTPFENLEKFFDNVPIDTESLNRLIDALKPIYNIIVDIGNFVKNHPNILAGLFAGFVASKIVTGIASIIGVAGGTVGLFGIATALSIIAGVSIAETINQFKDLRNVISEINESSQGLKEDTQNFSELLKGKINSLDEKTKKQISEYLERSINRMQQLLDLSNSQEEIDNLIESIKIAQRDLELLTGKKYEIDIKYKTTDEKNENVSSWNAFDFLKQGFREIYYAVLGTYPKFDVGTNYVPNDQLAMIHKGEMIVPKAYNPNAGYTGGNEETNALLYNIAEMLSNRQSATFEVDGREFARATYNEFENERIRLNTNTSFRKG